MGGLNAWHEAGHGGGAGADMKGLASGAEIGEDLGELDRPRIAPSFRRVAKEIKQPRRCGFPAAAFLALMRHQKAAAARRGENRLTDAGRPQAGNDGVKGIAAGAQNLRRRLGGRLMSGRYRPIMPGPGHGDRLAESGRQSNSANRKPACGDGRRQGPQRRSTAFGQARRGDSQAAGAALSRPGAAAQITGSRPSTYCVKLSVNMASRFAAWAS